VLLYFNVLIEDGRGKFDPYRTPGYFYSVAEILERGNIYYFYRPKIDAETPRDVQRFYMVLKGPRLYRVFVIGAKKLPETVNGRPPRGRRWAYITAVSDDSAAIEEILKGGEYETETRGRRHLPPSATVGEGRYALVSRVGHSELVHRLKLDKPKPLEDQFGLTSDESFILAVKNPDIYAPGFPETKPGIPRGSGINSQGAAG
jgi:hypothetical protein